MGAVDKEFLKNRLEEIATAAGALGLRLAFNSDKIGLIIGTKDFVESKIYQDNDEYTILSPPKKDIN